MTTRDQNEPSKTLKPETMSYRFGFFGGMNNARMNVILSHLKDKFKEEIHPTLIDRILLEFLDQLDKTRDRVWIPTGNELNQYNKKKS